MIVAGIDVWLSLLDTMLLYIFVVVLPACVMPMWRCYLLQLYQHLLQLCHQVSLSCVCKVRGSIVIMFVLVCNVKNLRPALGWGPRVRCI